MNSDDISESDSKIVGPDFTPRRATRNRTRPKKYDEYLETSPTKRKSYKYVESSDEDIAEESTPKPKALFSNDDVEGQDMFKFKSRHTKHDLQNKVKTVVGNVQSPMRTPKKNINLLQRINDGNTQTPKHIVDKMKKKIIAEVENSSNSDYSGSSSDFVPDKSDESSSSSESNSESENESQPKTTALQFTRNSNRNKSKDSEYFVTSDNYFAMNSTKKITTSDHTLARLKNMNIQEDDRDAPDRVTPEHGHRTEQLARSHERLFDRWLYALSEGFNVLLYGVGSKRSVLRGFRERVAAPCAVVDGSFPGLTVGGVVDVVADELLGERVDGAAGLQRALRRRGTTLCLLVHNIDAPALRNARAQAALAGLAALHNVSLVATLDHINAPTLWDHSKLSKYKFVYFDVTTFRPYEREAAGAGLARGAGGLQLAALTSVYGSLTANAKGIFDIIAEYQLEHCKRPHYTGVPLKELYALSRERFLCSSVGVLRAHLTEFIDHRLVRLKRSELGDFVKVALHDDVLTGFRHTLHS